MNTKPKSFFASRSERLCIASVFILSATAMRAPGASTSTTPPVYQNRQVPVEERVKDLLDRMTPEEKARQLDMFDSPATLAPNEVEYLADFLMAKVIGKGPLTRDKCADFWGHEDDACADLPK